MAKSQLRVHASLELLTFVNPKEITVPKTTYASSPRCFTNVYGRLRTGSEAHDTHT